MVEAKPCSFPCLTKVKDIQVHGKNLYLAFGRSIKAQDHCEPSLNDKSKKEESLMMEASPDPKEHSESSTSEETCLRKWLRFHFGLYGSIRANEFARARKGNKRGDWKDPTARLTVHFDSGGFLVFYNCRMVWCSCPLVDPSCDVLSPEFDKEKALQVLSSPAPVCITLMDQRHFSGVGNIIKNEILYLARVHPLSWGSRLSEQTLVSLIDYTVKFTSDWLRDKMKNTGQHYHIYMKDQCQDGHEVVKDSIGPPNGLKRLTWYCPTCQVLVKPEDGEKPVTS
ncbi:endonuclease 8-like 2 [Gastrophryne carolinensis]